MPSGLTSRGWSSATRCMLTGLAVTSAACSPPRVAPPPSATPSLTSMVVESATGRSTALDLRHESSVGQRAVPFPLADVWAILPAIFAQLEIEPTRIQADQGVMGNPNFRARRIEGRRISAWFDCGRSFGREYADQYAVTAGVLVQLVAGEGGQTNVRTVLDAYARDPSTSGNAVHCVTRGSLERRIGELVAERLAP